MRLLHDVPQDDRQEQLYNHRPLREQSQRNRILDEVVEEATRTLLRIMFPLVWFFVEVEFIFY